MVSTRVDLTENRIFAQRQPRFVDTIVYKKKLPWLEKIDPTFKTVHHDNDLSRELGFAIYGPIERPFFVGTFEEINRHKEYFLMYLSDMGYIVPVCENCGEDLSPIRYAIEKRRLCKSCVQGINDTHSCDSLYRILREYKESQEIHTLFNGITIEMPTSFTLRLGIFRNIWRTILS